MANGKTPPGEREGRTGRREDAKGERGVGAPAIQPSRLRVFLLSVSGDEGPGLVRRARGPGDAVVVGRPREVFEGAVEESRDGAREAGLEGRQVVAALEHEGDPAPGRRVGEAGEAAGHPAEGARRDLHLGEGV